jgi:hypothetical protein
MKNKPVRRAKPSDTIFCARRAWDHATEVRFIKKIEDDFQRLVDLIIDGQVSRFSQEQTHIIGWFYALWLTRVQIRDRPEKDGVMPGIWPDHAFSKDQEERMEKTGYGFCRANLVPARLINGVALHIHAARRFRQIKTINWCIVQASGGEFIVPDWPLDYVFVPITPTLAVANSAAINQRLDRSAVRLVNERLRSASRHYFFARDFAACF